jgi:hypothetical protein
MLRNTVEGANKRSNETGTGGRIDATAPEICVTARARKRCVFASYSIQGGVMVFADLDGDASVTPGRAVNVRMS